ncbi:MAG: serine hydrolase domain-containing protein, partial [Kaistella sp.]
MFLKIIKGLLVFFALAIALSYSFGYGYLFNGIRQTYLRGEAGSTIDDGQFFPSHKIPNGKPVLWEKDTLYNKKQLPKTLVQDLKNT